MDESSITGESKAIKKSVGATAYAGTTVVDGDALAIVTATGSNSVPEKLLI